MKKIKLKDLLENNQLLKENDINIEKEALSDFFDFNGDIRITNNIKKPLVSFIIPTYNRYNMLRQMLKSISKQIDSHIEIIIINDNSSDKKYDNIINDYKYLPFKYIKNNISNGPGISRLSGYLQAKGKYIVFADDDDFYISESFLLEGINKLEDNLDLVFVSYNTITYYEEEGSILLNKINSNGQMNGQDYFLNFINKYQKPTSTFPTIFRKEYLDSADFKNMEMMNDSSIYLRALTQGNAFIFDRYIGVYRVHPTNISKSLPHQFILDNIKEKNNIYQLASKTFKSNLSNWQYNQILDTFRYYVIDSNCNIKNAKDFINYTNKITSISKTKLYYNYLKFLIMKKIINR